MSLFDRYIFVVVDYQLIEVDAHRQPPSTIILPKLLPLRFGGMSILFAGWSSCSDERYDLKRHACVVIPPFIKVF